MPGFRDALRDGRRRPPRRELSWPTSRPTRTPRPVSPARLAGLLETSSTTCSASAPSLTRIEVAERAGVPLEMAVQLWRLLGFADQRRRRRSPSPQADVEALRASPRPDGARHPRARTRRPRWCAPGAAASPGWPSGRPRCWPTSPARTPDPEARLTDLAARCCRGSRRCRATSGAGTWPAPSSRLVAVQSGGTAAARPGGLLRRHRRLHLAQQVARRERAGGVAGGVRGHRDRHRRGPRRPDHQDHRRRDPLRRRRPRGRGRDRAAADRARRGPRRPVPVGAGRRSRTARWSAASATCSARS